jgi:hypothetical protein
MHPYLHRHLDAIVLWVFLGLLLIALGFFFDRESSERKSEDVRECIALQDVVAGLRVHDPTIELPKLKC